MEVPPYPFVLEGPAQLRIAMLPRQVILMLEIASNQVCILDPFTHWNRTNVVACQHSLALSIWCQPLYLDLSHGHH